MKRWILPLAISAFLAGRAAAAQDPSDAIYDESRIATFTFSMTAADWKTLTEYDDGRWYRADMTWQPPGGALEAVPGVGLRRSGGGPATGAYSYSPKPSFRISFNEFEFANPAGPGTPGRKWRDVNRIKLDSMIGNTDYAMMRDRVAYGILRAMGVPAPRACHARVTVNGDFKGLYTVEEPVRKDFVRYRWGEDGGNLYEVEYGSTATYDWQGSDPASYVPSPFEAHTNYPGGDYRDLVELINIVNNVPADQIWARMDGHINLDRFLTYLAVTTVYGDNDDIVHWGGGSNNHYWYHRAGTNKMELIKWDPGASQGMYEGYFGIPNFRGESPLGYRYGDVRITAWVVNNATAWATYKAKIRQVLDGPVASIQSRIDTIHNEIKSHAYEDPYKGMGWGPTAPDPDGFTNAEFDAYLPWYKDWWTRRVNYLRSQVGSSGTNGAQYVSQNVPTSMAVGQTYSVTVTMRNTGTTTWTAGATYHLRSQNPPANFTWGVDRATLAAADSIAPNQTKTFTWSVTAPAAAGTYNFQWQMRQSSADDWFGDLTPNVAVTVSDTAPPPPPPGANGAQFVSQTVPSVMVAGQTTSVSVTMRNTGTTPWTDGGGYSLTSQNPAYNTTWGLYRVYLAAGESIAPNATKTFTWSVTAPAAAGTYDFQWRMRQSGVEWFGDLTANVAVQVLPPGSAGTGLTGEYYDSIDLTGTPLVRTDATLDFDWGAGSPDPTIAPDTFSVRWSGQVTPGFSETYTFIANFNNGVRVWVDGTLLIDSWTDAWTELSGTIALVAGVPVDLRVEYYENAGNAMARLSWSSPSLPREVIPQSRLTPAASGGGGGGGEGGEGCGATGMEALLLLLVPLLRKRTAFGPKG
jgi:hypothetical protein